MDLSPTNLCIAGILAVVSGTALLLIGVGNRKRKAAATTALAMALALAVAAGAAWGAGSEGWLTLSLAGLASAWLGFAVLRCGLLLHLSRLAAHPASQATMLLAGGVCAVGLGMGRLDANMQKEMKEADLMLEQASRPHELRRIDLPGSLTDAGRSIEFSTLKPDASESQTPFPEDEYLRQRQMNLRLIQTGEIDSRYNCHGWVFAAGRCWIRSSQVRVILEDNGYREVKRPVVGDLAVFIDAKKEVTHTAVVRGHGEQGTVLLESKWGKLGRYIHTARHHLYQNDTISYYRTSRGSHILAGIRATPDADPEIAVAE